MPHGDTVILCSVIAHVRSPWSGELEISPGDSGSSFFLRSSSWRQLSSQQEQTFSISTTAPKRNPPALRERDGFQNPQFAQLVAGAAFFPVLVCSFFRL
jgi:hypothetical protein